MDFVAKIEYKANKTAMFCMEISYNGIGVTQISKSLKIMFTLLKCFVTIPHYLNALSLCLTAYVEYD